MRKTGKPRGERIAAWTAVFIVHALLAWTLMQLPAPLRDATTKDSALDLVWVAAPQPRPRPSAAREGVRSATFSRPAATFRVTPSHRESSPPAPIRAAQEPMTTQPLSAVFIRQAVERAVRQPPGSFQVDPFANRTARLPGRAANRFRMRSTLSPAERLALVGKLFGGNDDPCRSNRDSINELSQAGDSRDLQNALDYEKRFCR